MQYAERLQTLAEALGDALDPHERAQILAYVSLLRCAERFIQGQWDTTLRVCSATRALLTAVAECATSSRDEALASSFLDSLDAQVRFAAYSLGETGEPGEVAARTATPDVCEASLPGSTALMETLRALPHASHAPLELKWRTHTIPVRSLDLHDVVARIQHEEGLLAGAERDDAAPSAERSLRLTHAERNSKRRGARIRTQITNHGMLDPFDRVLAALSDAEGLVRALVDENAQALAKSHSIRYEATGRDLRRAHELLMYRLLSVRTVRNARLVVDVQKRASRRETRARAVREARSQRPSAVRSVPRPSAKRPQPGSRAKRPRDVPKKHIRRPGRSGTRARNARALLAREERAAQVAESQRERRSTRIVPGLAKLLDSIDSALLTMGGLEMVEGEPDVSSLLEAKRFYYCGELLVHLARVFARHALQGEALVLMQRAELYGRQAAQSLELAEGAEDEDIVFPPQLLQGGVLESLAVRVDTVRDEVRAAAHSKRTVPMHGKAGQTLYYYALKHVSLEPEVVEHALASQVVEPAGADEVDEIEEIEMESPVGAEASTTEAPAAEADVLADPLAPFDPGNAFEEEEERKAPRKSGWLSWFMR